jgi:hypothetical protein
MAAYPYSKGTINLNAVVFKGTFDLVVPELELHGVQITATSVNQGSQWAVVESGYGKGASRGDDRNAFGTGRAYYLVMTSLPKLRGQ